MDTITYEGPEYIQVQEAYIAQDGGATLPAIRADEEPDSMGAVTLYELRYVLIDPEDYENGPNWEDNVDWSEPDGIEETPYGWLVDEGRII